MPFHDAGNDDLDSLAFYCLLHVLLVDVVLSTCMKYRWLIRIRYKQTHQTRRQDCSLSVLDQFLCFTSSIVA
jgi:hypothetical protein